MIKWQVPAAAALAADARKLIGEGLPTLAYDLLQSGLAEHHNDPELSYLSALALANCGSWQMARKHLDSVMHAAEPYTPIYVEAISLAGRISKSRYANYASSNPNRQQVAQESAAKYLQAFTQSQEFFPGINAATMTLLAGEEATSRDLAEQVKSICLTHGEPKDPWAAATLGEANLLLSDQEQAIHWYRQAAILAGNRFGYLASMKRQLCLLAEVLPLAEKLAQCLEIPRVVAFVGHMLDHPTRAVPRFPHALVPEVTERIGQAIDDRKIGIGYVSLACGGDILFAEAMLARNLEVHIWLPFQEDDFIQTSVVFAGAEWVERFHKVLARATTVSYAIREDFMGDDILFDYTAKLLMGACLYHAQRLLVEPLLLALVAIDSQALLGGTLESLKQWQALGHPAIQIDLTLSNKDCCKNTTASATKKFVSQTGQRLIRTMIFADIVGFSKISESFAPVFMIHFLDTVAKIIDSFSNPPLFRNTWGDGLFLVFDQVTDAALFALILCQAIQEHDWEALGFSAHIGIRVGIHTGPVFPGFDPIIQHDNYFGTHVNYAARIEPITAPGAIFVSEQTTFLLAMSGDNRFVCDYLGEKILPKQTGIGRVYRLRWRNEEG